MCRFGLKYIYCWHGLPAYWAGLMPDAPEVGYLLCVRGVCVCVCVCECFYERVCMCVCVCVCVRPHI